MNSVILRCLCISILAPLNAFFDTPAQEAAEVRDQLREVVQKNIEEAQKRTASDAVTQGVRVRVRRCLLVWNHIYCAVQIDIPVTGELMSYFLFGMQLLCAKSVISRSEAVLLCLLCHNQ